MTDKAHSAAQARVEAFLDRELPKGATRASGQLKGAAEAAGVPWRSVQRAKDQFGVVIDEAATPTGRLTVWTRPGDPKPAAPEPDTDRDGVPVRRGQLGRQAAALLQRGRYDRKGGNR